MNETNKAIPVRSLMDYDAYVLKDNLTGNHNIVFEDNVVINMNVNVIVYNRHTWEMLEPYTDMAIISDYSITSHYKNGLFTGGGALSHYSKIMKDVLYNIFTNNIGTIGYNMSNIWAKLYSIQEKILSKLSRDIMEYMPSADIEDLLEIQLNKELMDSIQGVKDANDLLGVDPSVSGKIEKAINYSYSVLDKLMKSPEYKHNPISRAYLANTVSDKQMKQVLSVRGVVSDPTNSIFPVAVATSYTLGHQNVADVLMDSTTAAKALSMQDEAIREAENTGKHFMLAAQSVERIVYGDCGTNEYINFYVAPKDGAYKGGLANIVDKWYYDDELGKEIKITKDMTNIYGRVIKLRSATKCRLPNPKHVCSKCFGDLAYNIPSHANLGQLCTTVVSEKISQSILSTKHLITSASVADIILDDSGKMFLRVKNGTGLSISIDPNIKATSKKINMVLPIRDFRGIKDITLDNVSDLSPDKISSIDTINIETIDDDGKITDTYPIQIRVDNRYGYFETKFLEYILDNHYEITTDKLVVIDISRYKFQSPVIKLRDVEFNFLAMVKGLKKLLKDDINNKKSDKRPSIDKHVSDLYAFINNKLDINIAYLDTFVYALTGYDVDNGNYSLGRFSDKVSVISYIEAITNRSAGSMLNYERHANNMIKPRLYMETMSTNHPMDVYVKPDDVLNNLDYF